MDIFKKILRRFFIVLLMLLAGFGVGISGAAILPTKIREDSNREAVCIEVVESGEDVEVADDKTLELS